MGPNCNHMCSSKKEAGKFEDRRGKVKRKPILECHALTMEKAASGQGIQVAMRSRKRQGDRLSRQSLQSGVPPAW